VEDAAIEAMLSRDPPDLIDTSLYDKRGTALGFFGDQARNQFATWALMFVRFFIDLAMDLTVLVPEESLRRPYRGSSPVPCLCVGGRALSDAGRQPGAPAWCGDFSGDPGFYSRPTGVGVGNGENTRMCVYARAGLEVSARVSRRVLKRTFSLPCGI
jgi:hypothetical protein